MYANGIRLHQPRHTGVTWTKTKRHNRSTRTARADKDETDTAAAKHPPP